MSGGMAKVMAIESRGSLRPVLASSPCQVVVLSVRKWSQRHWYRRVSEELLADGRAAADEACDCLGLGAEC